MISLLTPLTALLISLCFPLILLLEAAVLLARPTRSPDRPSTPPPPLPRPLRILDRTAAGLLAAAGGLILILLVLRSLRWSFPALTTTYEALLLLTAAASLLLLRLPQPLRLWGTLPAAALWALASSPLISAANHPPVPALQSGWLLLHILLTILGEACFTAAFVTALLDLFKGARPGADTENSPDGSAWDRLTYRLIALGYPLYTAGALLFGAVWAYHAWGRFWGWDPKEVWALITWLVYTLYLHQRLTDGRHRRWVRLLPVLGFLAALFTFLGVNYLMAGLHSYG